MKVQWIGQSGYVLENPDTRIVIDPYLSDCVFKASGKARLVPAPLSPKTLKADAVICTHDHLDHLDPDAIAEMDRENILFLCPPSCEAHLRELGCKHVSVMRPGEQVKINSIRITAVPAFHSIEAIGIAAEDEDGKRLYFTSDTLYHDDLAKMRDWKPDILFICINGKLGNMNVEEAIRVTQQINPRLGIPTHYGMFAANTEDPALYTSKVPSSFAMEFDHFYTVEELLGGASS